MKEFSDYLVQHLESIIAALMTVISVIVAFTRKRPSADSIKTSILSYITVFMPADINVAEGEFKDGKNKKDYVIQKGLDFVSKSVVLDEKGKDRVRVAIGEAIEAFLSTPQKK